MAVHCEPINRRDRTLAVTSSEAPGKRDGRGTEREAEE